MDADFSVVATVLRRRRHRRPWDPDQIGELIRVLSRGGELRSRNTARVPRGGISRTTNLGSSKLSLV
jgi:hypothetical protein